MKNDDVFEVLWCDVEVCVCEDLLSDGDVIVV